MAGTTVSHPAVNLIVVICAIGVALLATAGAAVMVWRVRAAADAEVADAVANLAAGMHETIRGLTEEFERAQGGGRLHAAELSASLDLDDVSERTLEAAAAVPGVEAALLRAAAPEGARLVATIGMAADEAA